MTDFDMTRGFLARTWDTLHNAFRGLGQGFNVVHKRQKFKKLLDLDDRMLDDMGVHRFEVERAARLPLSVDAGVELHRMSLERRSRKM